MIQRPPSELGSQGIPTEDPKGLLRNLRGMPRDLRGIRLMILRVAQAPGAGPLGRGPGEPGGSLGSTSGGGPGLGPSGPAPRWRPREGKKPKKMRLRKNEIKFKKNKIVY